MNAALKGTPTQGNLVETIAHKVQFIYEREIDASKASVEVARLVYESFSSKEKLPFFVSFLKELLDNEDTIEYVPSVLTALSWADGPGMNFPQFTEDYIHRSVQGHWKKDLPEYNDVESGKSFSYYGNVIGESFIQLFKQNRENYEIISEVFSSLVRHEMDLEQSRLEQKYKDRLKKKKDVEEAPTNSKKLYDDIFGYITERSIYRTETLVQVNPVEFIGDLADKLRSTRRYCMQDVMNKKALLKKKDLEKQLKEREASAEEIMASFSPLKQGLALFQEAKQYNGKYMDAEKRRMTMQILPVLVATTCLGAALMELTEFSMGFYFVFGLMIIIPKFLFSKPLMTKMYPIDKTGELEVELGHLMGTFKKCSQKQLDSLLNRVIKEMTNAPMMHHLPDFISYVFTVMPDRKSALIRKDELDGSISHLRRSVSQRQRQLQMLAQ